MQRHDRYREFADILADAADAATDHTRDLLFRTAEAWRKLADDAEVPQAPAEVVDFAEAAARLRRAG